MSGTTDQVVLNLASGISNSIIRGHAPTSHPRACFRLRECLRKFSLVELHVLGPPALLRVLVLFCDTSPVCRSKKLIDTGYVGRCIGGVRAQPTHTMSIDG